MSAALFESPISTTVPTPVQLVFAWPESEPTTTVDTPQGPRQPRSLLPNRAVPASRTSNRALGCHHAATSETPLASRPAANRAERVGEVRIGSVMIKLLKRYGITDAEIEQGLADYAAKTCTSLAS